MTQKRTPTSSDVSSTGLDEAKSLVEKITALVGSPPALTATDRKRSAKLRKGGETVIQTVAALATQFGLSVPGYSTQTMLAQLKQAQDLLPLHKQMVTALKKVEDSIFLAHSESWSSATVHYTMLRRLAKKDGDLAKALAPVSQFFAARSEEVVAAEDAKRGGKKGSKAAKAAKAQAAVSDAPSNESPVTATTNAATPTAAPSPAPASDALPITRGSAR